MRRKRYIVVLIFAITILLVYAYLKKTNFIEIDACLDHGGRWNYQTEECDTTSDRTIGAQKVD